MGGTKRQLEEYEEFLVNRPPVRMNADTQANILTMALEATRLDLEKARMQLEELRERRRMVETLGVEGIIDQSFDRIYRIVAETIDRRIS